MTNTKPLTASRFSSIDSSQIVAALDLNKRTPLCDIMTDVKSDKGTKHNYTILYHALLAPFLSESLNFLEVGIGSMNPDIAWNVAGHGQAGASLIGWSRYLKRANIFGADIDATISVAADRVKTTWVDQTDPNAIAKMVDSLSVADGFDIIIDDGMHTAQANACLLLGLFSSLRPGGIYIIEDIPQQDDATLRAFANTIAFGFKFHTVVDLPSPWGAAVLDNRIAVFQKKN